MHRIWNFLELALRSIGHEIAATIRFGAVTVPDAKRATAAETTAAVTALN